MKQEKRTLDIFVCEVCGHEDLSQYAHNEKTCAMRKADRDKYESNRENAIETAVQAAKKDPTLKLLVENGMMEEAEEQARSVYYRVVSWDSGCGSSMNAVYKKMCEAAK